MDEKDDRMGQLLFVNSRMLVRDLADAIRVSVQAAHGRLQSLVDKGEIRKFTANLSLSYLYIIQGYFSGKPELESRKKVIEAL